MQRGATEEALAQAGFDAFVSFAEERDPDDQACDDRPGVVWSQSPDQGGRGISLDGHDPRDPVVPVPASAPVATGADGRPGDTKALPRSK
jgi:hypothetical protein